jgi:hypothetical protein
MLNSIGCLEADPSCWSPVVLNPCTVLLLLLLVLLLPAAWS